MEQVSRVWEPDAATIAGSNLAAVMRDHDLDDFRDLYRWSIDDRIGFWKLVIDRLGIVFAVPPEEILGSPGDVEAPDWLAGARLNIAESCFRKGPGSDAVVYAVGSEVRRLTYGDLRALVMQAANGLRTLGVEPGDRVAIAMSMTVEAVVAYLATVWVGAVVVSIADSFAPDEIRVRLRIADCDTVITQDEIRRAGKDLPMYDKVVEAGAARAIVVDTGAGVSRRAGDLSWDAFLGPVDDIAPVHARPSTPTNILFSSGTTGDPKAITWTQLSPIKAAMDGHFHQDIHPDDVVAWPTNIGWMMGPWLIYAPLIGGAALALYDDAPTEPEFGRFVEQAGVSILGVIPSLVATWRARRFMEQYDWSTIRLFSSTGEVSNSTDMSYLMDLAKGKPVIEYCGGTELAGGYITGTVLQRAVPSQFSTPTLGIDLKILDDEGQASTSGEVFLVPPSIGMSETLLNRDHHEVYYEDTPVIDGVKLRRHGDHMEAVGGGYYRAHGRIDDTMNLGGIKVSSAEIERTAVTVPGITESAAVAVSPPGGGPSRLVVFVVALPGTDFDPEEGRAAIQSAIRAKLNPLFKVHEAVLVDELPRTATNKVMRRLLREGYPSGS